MHDVRTSSLCFMCSKILCDSIAPSCTSYDVCKLYACAWLCVCWLCISTVALCVRSDGVVPVSNGQIEIVKCNHWQILQMQTLHVITYSFSDVWKTTVAEQISKTSNWISTVTTEWQQRRQQHQSDTYFTFVWSLCVCLPEGFLCDWLKGALWLNIYK